MRRDFVRRIEKVAYALAAEADKETNMAQESHIDAQAIADVAVACIADIHDLLNQAIKDGIIEGMHTPKEAMPSGWSPIAQSFPDDKTLS